MTKNELLRNTNAKLVEMCGIYNITVPKKAKKPELVDMLLKVMNPETKTDEKSRFNITTMRSAIVAAHNCGNKHAITEMEAVAGGATKEQFTNYRKAVIALKEKADKYITVNFQKVDTANKKAIYDEIFPVWKETLLAGELDQFHPNMWVDEHDVVNIIHYDILDQPTDKGLVRSTQTELVFRKGIETYIGMKVANNGVMTAENRDKLQKNKSALKRQDIMLKRLDGYDTEEGHVDGLRDELKKAERDITTLNANLEKAKQEVAEYDSALEENVTLANDKWFIKAQAIIHVRIDNLSEQEKEMAGVIKNLKKRISDAEKVLSNAEKEIKETKDDVEKIEKELNLATI